MPAVRKSASSASAEPQTKPDWERPDRCAWSGVCPNVADGKSYERRKLCAEHAVLAHGLKPGMPCWPRQMLCVVLRLPLTKEERAMIGTMSYAEREEKIKGLPCETCGRNVPDPGDTAVKVWCWKCVMYRKYVGAEAPPTAAPVVAPVVGPHRLSDIPRATKAGSGTDAILNELSEGRKTFVFTGPKGKTTFTQGSSPGTVAVQDPKGITTYRLADEDHNRILRGRWDRWNRKDKPAEQAGKVALKGPKLEVVIKG